MWLKGCILRILRWWKTGRMDDRGLEVQDKCDVKRVVRFKAAMKMTVKSIQTRRTAFAYFSGSVARYFGFG